MGPIDYTTQIQAPLQSAIQGYQTGLGIQDTISAQAQAEQQRAAQAQMSADLQAASRDVRLLPQVMVRYPQLAEKLKVGWESMNADQQRNSLDHATQVMSALQSGRPEVAKSLLTDRAAAMRASGDERGAKTMEDMATWADTHPESLKTSIGMRIAALPGGDKVIEGIAKLGGEQRAQGMYPAELATKEAAAREGAAKATSAEVAAKYAEPAVLRELELKGWQIEAIKSDSAYKKEANRIAAMNAATSAATNDLRRQELALKVQEAQQKLDSTVREKVATAEAGASSIDNMLNTIERIKANPRLDDVIGGIEGRMPAVRDESVDAIALIETLGSQAFLAQIPNIKGMGALSNAEGDKLQSALQNLSRAQSEGQFRKNLDEAARLLKKGRESLSKSTGVPLGKPDTPAAPGARPPLESFSR